MKLHLRADKFLLYATAMSAFCMVVLGARLLYTLEKEYLFLAKNLVLAWMPYAISLLIKKTTSHKALPKKTALFISWLLFFPNSAYILTDIYHLNEYPSVPQWYDLLMLISFSWAGLLWGFYSLHIVQKRFFEKRSIKANVLFVITIFFLAGMGIYFGRYERWNSWDVLFDIPFLYQRMQEIIHEDYLLKYIAGMSLLYCGVLSLIYYHFTQLQFKNFTNK